MADRPDDEVRWDRKVQVRLVRGEAAALGELYDRHARLVHALAARFLGEEQAARELVTEVFTHLWQHPETFDPAHHALRTWLAMETSERAAKRLAGGGSGIPASAGHAGPDGPGRAAGLVEITRADTVLGSMRSKVLATLHLVHAGNLDYREAAAELGITEEEGLRRLRLGLQLMAGPTDVAREGRR